MHPSLINKVGELVTTDMEKTEVLKKKKVPQSSLAITLPTSLKCLNLLGEWIPQPGGELADVIAKSRHIIAEKSWQAGEVPSDWNQGSITAIFQRDRKDNLGNYPLVSLTSVPEKSREQILLETILKHTEDRDVIWGRQHGFTEGKFSNLLKG